MKILISILLLFTVPLLAQAQIGKRVKQTTKRQVENKAARETSKSVDKAMDKAIDGVKGIFRKKNRKEKTQKSTETDATPNNKTSDKPFVISGKDTTTEFGVYSNFTFIPGDKVLFYDDFSKNASGDFPSQWKTGGTGAVVSLATEAGNWLSLQRRSGYLPEMPKQLPENYTIEFDLITNGYGAGKGSSKLYISFLPKKALSMGSAGSSANVTLGLYNTFHVVRVENFGSEAKMVVGSNIDRNLAELTNARMHVSIAVNKERLRFWINEEKYVDAPSLLQNKLNDYFLIEARDILPENGHFAGITNFRIAESTEDLRSKLMKDGKFSTSGIYFNTNSATIKKESFGILKSIAEMLKTDGNLKLNIVGHTDAEGQENFNQELSLRRAEAVKTILVKNFSIAENRFEFSGKGESAPVDDNNTLNGRANNRRVEFIKI